MPGGQRKFTANNNQRHPGQPSVPGLLDTKHAVAHIDQDSWQRYLEAARYRHAAAKPRAGAPSAISAHCDALQNVKFVPVMPSPRMLLPSASADDQTREPIALHRRRAAMSMSTAPGHQTRMRTGTHFGDPHYCNHHDRSGGS